MYYIFLGFRWSSCQRRGGRFKEFKVMIRWNKVGGVCFNRLPANQCWKWPCCLCSRSLLCAGVTCGVKIFCLLNLFCPVGRTPRVFSKKILEMRRNYYFYGMTLMGQTTLTSVKRPSFKPVKIMIKSYFDNSNNFNR
jgi:hypothetical protein